MDFNGRSSVLDELDEHGEVSEFRGVTDDELDLLEDLQDVHQEQLGSLRRGNFLNTGRLLKRLLNMVRLLTPWLLLRQNFDRGTRGTSILNTSVGDTALLQNHCCDWTDCTIGTGGTSCFFWLIELVKA